MAKQVATQAVKKTKVNRKGVHAKTKFSSSKSSKYYTKPYKGQGR